MRMPLIRFGNDDRPIEPWEDRLAPIVLPIVVPLLFAAVMLMSAVGVCLVLGWAALSPVLPRSWRLDWETAFDLDPSVDPECPECRSRLSLGPVDKRGHTFQTEQGHEFVMPAQTADCSACKRSFRRYSLGKLWSGWQ
jgi:hypothetical protein